MLGSLRYPRALSARSDPTRRFHVTLMPIRRLVLLALCSTALACTVSPIPSSSPAPSGVSSQVEEPRVRTVVDGYLQNSARKEAGDLSIASVDITGDVAAVKVVETYPKEVYVDYLNLARAGGEWRVVNKVGTHWSR
jgi:hypothetical protein